jgi:hypothetical protein
MPPGAAQGAGTGDDHRDVTVLAVGDERLLPVEDVLVTVAHRPGEQTLQVAAGRRLAHRDRADSLARQHARQPGLPDRLAAEVQDVAAGNIAVRSEVAGGPGVSGVGAFFDQDRVEAEVAGAAVLLGHLGAEHPGPAGPQPQVAVDDPRFLPGLEVRGDLAVQEPSHGGAKVLVVLVVDRAVADHRIS